MELNYVVSPCIELLSVRWKRSSYLCKKRGEQMSSNRQERPKRNLLLTTVLLKMERLYEKQRVMKMMVQEMQRKGMGCS